MFKKKTYRLLTVFFTLTLLLTFTPLNFTETCSASQIISVNSISVHSGESIQEAINNAASGDRIFVYNGIYHEHLKINKTVQLIGENPAETIIDGDGTIIPIVKILAPNVTIQNFTVRNTASNYETYGISVRKTRGAQIINNIVKEAYFGILIENSSKCIVSNNTVTQNFQYGIRLRINATDNTVVGNSITDNPTGVSIADPSCQNNIFYHNNFVNKYHQAQSYGTNNQWNEEYPIGGNYWSDYTGADANGDRIGDTPYITLGVNDTYPLMNPWGNIPPIAHFTYTPKEPTKNQIITFNASESYDPDGNISTYKWDFGDGNITLTTNITIKHRYMDYGNYTVTLTVTDQTGLTDSTPKTVTVQKITSTLSIQVNPPKIEIGKNTTISGKLYPPKETTITIKYKLAENAWQTLTTLHTDSQGNYQYSWTPTTLGVYTLMASWEGDEYTFPANSSKIILNVTKIVSTIEINVPNTAFIGLNLTITGKLTPPKEGAEITISYSALFNAWKTIATVKTDSQGNFFYNFSTTEMQTGVIYMFKASWQGDSITYGCEKFSGFVSLTKQKSNITINVDPQTVTEGSNLTITGKITPSRINATVIIQFTLNEKTWNITVKTDSKGQYKYDWTPSQTGDYKIRAIWQGDSQTLPAESEVTVRVDPVTEAPFHYLIVGLILIIIISVIIIKTRKK